MIIALDKRNSIFYFQNNSWGIPTGKCLPGFPEREIAGERRPVLPFCAALSSDIYSRVMDEGLIMIHG